ncbi:MAG: 50S ribosomal protein L11 methyltransferase [Rhizobiaceae bacterium]
MSQSRLYFNADKPEAMRMAELLDPQFEEEAITTVLFETEQDNGDWCYSIYVPADDVAMRRQQMTDRLAADGITMEVNEEVLGDIDWVSETLRELTPVEAGRFFVHGSHDNDEAKTKRVPIQIDAGQAFGTGHHGTTAGCLDMLEICLRQSAGILGLPRRAYDIGTGSGVLAIALAKVAHVPILATDIDPIATKVAKENCVLNGVGNHVRCETATGFQHPIFNQFGPADLVFANILARPLEALAKPMRAHVNTGAQIILSGLLPHQRARIVAAYSTQNMVMERWHVRDDWLTLLMRAV